MRRAPPLGIVHVITLLLSQLPIRSADSRPSLCEPGITGNGPFSSSLSSKCSLMARMPAMISAGGCTCTRPAFIVHGPNPATLLRSRTAIVRSWCQTTFQLEALVLLKKIPRTAKHLIPRTASHSVTHWLRACDGPDTWNGQKISLRVPGVVKLLAKGFYGCFIQAHRQDGKAIFFQDAGRGSAIGVQVVGAHRSIMLAKAARQVHLR